MFGICVITFSPPQRWLFAEYLPFPCSLLQWRGVPELDMAMLEVHDPSGRPEEAYFKSDGGGTELATIPALVSGCVLFQGCGPEPKICRLQGFSQHTLIQWTSHAAAVSC